MKLDHDAEVQKAIESLPQSKALLEEAKSIIARQSQQGSLLGKTPGTDTERQLGCGHPRAFATSPDR